MTPQADALQQQVDRELVRRSALGGFAYLFCLVMVAYSAEVWTQWRGPILFVLSCTSITAILRHRFDSACGTFYAANPRRYRAAHRAVLLSDATVWGGFMAATLHEFGPSSWTVQLLTIINAGSASVVMGVLSPNLRLTWAFLTILLTPAAAINIWLASERALTMGAIFLIYWGFTLIYSRRLHLKYMDSLRHNLALEEARTAAERANRSKSEFIANISHELRTPMNGIIGMTHLARNTPPGAEQQEYLEAVESSSHILLRLLNDLLDFAKIDAGKVSLETYEFSPSRIVQDTARLFAGVAKQKGIGLHADLDPEVPPAVMGDGSRMLQILVNLAANAVKFTEQGCVAIRLAVEQRTGSSAWLRFEVEDTGPGIPADKLRVIFEPFEQSDTSMTRRFGGTGLGLTISENLARMMGGRITVESMVGRGSVFRCCIPFGLAARHEVVAPARASAGKSAPHGRRRVLVAEDNAINQRLVRRLLERRGHVVYVASDGRKALEAVEHQLFDVVLMDVQMPEMDGLEVTARIRRSLNESIRRMRIVALTAHASAASRQEFLDAGMDDFLPKPIDPARLYEVVEQ
jgi:signal transduction histidine kinase